jgi:hypothetical protein
MNNILPDLVRFFRDNNKKGNCIKFTLGKYTNEFGFEPKLFNKNNYEKIKSSFDSYMKWGKTIEEVISEGDEAPMKVIDSIIINNNGPYDILVTAETTEKVDITDPNLDEINLYTYEWKRHNFLLKNYTFLIGDSIQKLEIYTTDNNVSSEYLAHSSLLKIKDIMDICKTGENLEEKMEILQKN